MDSYAYEPTMRFLGHNCFVIDTPNTVLITDPWLTPAGAFFGSWFQHPRNHHLAQDLVDLTNSRKCWIYISHEHQDHYDVDVLSKINKETKFIIPDYRDKFLRDSVEELGFECFESADSEEFSIGDNLTITNIISDVGVDHDSSVLIKTGSFTFFNQNDCKIFDRLEEIGPVDYYSVQFSGATWHPVCYSNYSPLQKEKISKKRTFQKLSNVARALEVLRPRFFVPAAGPAVFPFLPEELSLGEKNIFIHQPELHQFLEGTDIDILYPRPGDMVNGTTSRIPIPPPTRDEIRAYANDVKNPWGEAEATFSKEALIAVIEDRLSRISDLEFERAPPITFKWGDGDGESLTVDLNSKAILDQRPDGDLYEVSGDKNYFALMHSGARWQDVYLTLRASVRRTPDKFNSLANIFVFADPGNIRSAIESTLEITKERIVITGSTGKKYEIDRYCPHQGADLCHAIISDNNEVICPRHVWIFALDKGGINLKGDYSINAVPVEQPQQETVLSSTSEGGRSAAFPVVN